MSNFRLIAKAEAQRVMAGTIMFLPPREQVPKGAYTDPGLQVGAFNHPVVIAFCPQPKEITLSSHVEIAVVWPM